jgi:Domain of unknown function (DUF4384)
MLYQFLTHRLPFSAAGSATDVLEQIKHRVPPPPRTIDDKIPPALEEICLKAMAKSPADRYRTAADMAADLRRAVAGAPPAKRGIWFAVAAGGAAAAILLACWGMLRRNHNDQSNSPPPAAAISEAKAASIANASATAAAKLVMQQIGGQPAQLRIGTPRLEVHFQRAGERGVWNPLTGKKMSLHEGDKVQLHVSTLGEEPRYLYLYWYDAEGHAKRLWPKDEDVNSQQPQTHISVPAGEDEWFLIDSQRGAEMPLVAASDKPLTPQQLSDFERHLAFGPSDIHLDEVFHLASDQLAQEISRGLGGIVKSQKNPLSPDFEAALKSNFETYHGLVIPHQ